MVEAPFLQDFEDTPPALDIHRGIASQRKCDTFVGASQEDAVTVEEQRRTIRGDFSEAARNLFGIASNRRLKRQGERAEVRRKLAPEREVFIFEIQKHRTARSIPLHGGVDRFVDSGTRELTYESPFPFLAGGIGNPDLGSSLGGIKLDADGIDPNRRIRAEFDLPNDAIPDRLRILDIGVRTPDIELLAIVHADDEFMATGGDGPQVEDMRRTEGVLFSDGLSIDPDLTLPDHPLQQERDAAPLPIWRNLDRAAIPHRANEGGFAVQAGQAFLADYWLHGEGDAQARLICGSRE